ncbi:MAG: hypothetical protein IJ597_07300, partial [Synergistaceae bacterium]|nr:hypothetical protein [Synergistaceae bacterium]
DATKTASCEIEVKSGSSGGVEANGKGIEEMDETEVQENFSNTTEINVTGTISSANELQNIIDKLEKVTTIETLDLTQTVIEEVKFENTKVQSVNLTGNTNVKTVEVKNNAELKTLDVSGSSVQKVDASGCEELEEVKVENCAQLVELKVSNTAIAALNVKDCANLQTLDCSSCDIKDLNVNGCENLSDFNCSYNRLPVLNASKSRFPSLGKLDCRGQQISASLPRTFNINELLRKLLNLLVSNADADDEEVTYSKKIDSVKVYDAAGNPLTVDYNDETGDVSISGDPDKITYDYNTEFENTLMDVTISNTDETTPESGAYGSNSGCNSIAFGIGAVLALVFMKAKRK